MATYTGTSGSDAITVTDPGNFGDILLGLGGDDTLIATAGIDYFDGGDGNDGIIAAGAYGYEMSMDTLLGGAGDDGLISNVYSVVSGGSGHDILWVYGLGINILLPPKSFTLDLRPFDSGNAVSLFNGGGINADVEDVSFYFLWAGLGDGLVYNADNWTIIGSNRDESVQAGGGNDNLNGGGGDDFLDGWIGVDTIFGGSGDDYLNGGPGADYIDGGTGDDLIFAGDRAPYITQPIDYSIDTLVGGEGDDLIYAGAGDNVAGGDGTDTLLYVYDQFETITLDLRNIAYSGGVYYGMVGGGVVSGVEAIEVLFGQSGYHGNGAGSLNFYGMNFADRVTGSEYADTIRGEGGNDSIAGGVGNDLIEGGDGNDTLLGGAGENYLDGGAGFDIASYSDATSAVVVELSLQNNRQNTIGGGSDYLTRIEGVEGSNYDDRLNGSAGAESLSGYGGADTIYGGAGADTLSGGDGIDLLFGGLGDDVYVIDDFGDTIVEHAGQGADTVRTSIQYTLGANFENLTLTGDASYSGFGISGTGNGLNNYLHGNSVANTLEGLAGADTLFGAGGADTLIGGLGNDLYLVGSLSVFVTEVSGEGIDTVQTGLSSYTLRANFENLILTGAAVSGVGNIENNELTGHAGANSLSGLGGADTLRSGGGLDTLIGGLDDDLYVIAGSVAVVTELTGEGTDTVRTSLTTYTLDANVENLVLVGSALNGFGNAENNLITGNDNANVLKGFGGDDTLDGGGGNDAASYSGATGAVIVDLLTGTATGDGSDTLISIENITGSAFDDSLTGNAAANSINGWTGNDTLNGGTGNDTLAGGADNDVFLFNTALVAGNIDRITDFTAGSDLIHLDITIFSMLSGAGALAASAFRSGAAAMDADDRIIYNAVTGALFYDADGLGGAASVQFATLNAGLVLSSNDLMAV